MLTRRQLLRQASASVAALAAVPVLAATSAPKRMIPFEFPGTETVTITGLNHLESEIVWVYPRFDGGRLELLDRPLRAA